MTIGTRQGQVVPDFTLPDRNGDLISSRSAYMRRNMIIGILPKVIDDRWINWTESLSNAASRIPNADVACFVLAGPDLSGIPAVEPGVHLLNDQDASVRAKFEAQPSSDVGRLIVTNRHGLIYHTATGNPDDPGMDPQELPGWVEFVACRCS
jgi:hypothetical protein